MVSPNNSIPAVPRSTAFYPDEPKWAEANTQAEFYHHARLIALPVLLEVSTRCGKVDIAILRSDRSGIVAIVECKRNGRVVYGNSNQILRYKELGVPVYGLNDLCRAARLARTIKERHADDFGVPWREIVVAKKTIQRRQQYYAAVRDPLPKN